MRHIKLRLKIILALLLDNFTESTQNKAWWIWRKQHEKDYIVIRFGKEEFRRPSSFVGDIVCHQRDNN